MSIGVKQLLLLAPAKSRTTAQVSPQSYNFIVEAIPMRGPIVRIPAIYLLRRVLPLVFAACFLFGGCGSVQNMELAKGAVGQFHAQLDMEQYGAVYTAADNKFHSSMSETDFTNLLHAIHRKLGTVQKSDLRNSRMSWYFGQGAMVRLVYDTTFATGKGVETFVWHFNDNQPSLYSYYISSNDLIIK
jgi:Protein of unknown function (DUF4019)